MEEERAADILEWMSPDEAADVLGDLPEHKAEDLLERMEHEEKLDVQELLPYEDDEAGGLMTTEFVVLPKHLTAGEALARLREMADRKSTRMNSSDANISETVLCLQKKHKPT